MGLRGLAGKVAVVAGGATGIGAATAARLGEEGCLVVVGDVAVDTAQRTAARIARPGARPPMSRFDLADPALGRRADRLRRSDLRRGRRWCSTWAPT